MLIYVLHILSLSVGSREKCAQLASSSGTFYSSRKYAKSLQNTRVCFGIIKADPVERTNVIRKCNYCVRVSIAEQTVRTEGSLRLSTLVIFYSLTSIVG